MPFASINLLTKGPIHEILWKNIKNWGSWKMSFFSRPFWFFLHYGCFLQNLRKDFIRTNMHTTVLCSRRPRRAVQPRLETRPIVLNWRVSGHFSRHYVCIGHDNACSKLCHIYRAEASPPPVAQRFQITKIRQKVHKNFFEIEWSYLPILTKNWQISNNLRMQSPETEIMQICSNRFGKIREMTYGELIFGVF